MPEPLDALIVGAGPAGLTAAIYLGRFRRRFLVVESHDSRAAWIPRTRNLPGFPGGIEGEALLERLRDQAERYGAVIQRSHVEGLDRRDGLFLAVLGTGETIEARKVLLATGVIDNEPKLPAFRDGVKRGLVRICPICDGYEAIGLELAVIGDSEKAAREALFLTTYSDKIALIHVGEPSNLPADARQSLAEAGIETIDAPIDDIIVQDGRIAALDLGGGVRRPFDAIYSALGTTPRGRLAERLGAKVDPGGCLQVGPHQETSVEGLYAAGDLVRGLNQIAVAEAEAAIAAVDIHNRLTAPPLTRP